MAGNMQSHTLNENERFLEKEEDKQSQHTWIP